jgi:hypothetical protein
MLNKTELKGKISNEKILNSLSKLDENFTFQSALATDKNIDINFYLWAEHFLPLTPQDRIALHQRLKIKDSHAYYRSYAIENCYKIADSKVCANSTNVENSEFIRNSNLIYSSSEVEESTAIKNCEDIRYSSFCSNSQKVMHSHYIVNSKDITSCYGVSNSQRVNYSYYVYDVKNTIDSILCIGGSHDHHILCDENCSPEHEFAIFNKPVSQMKFELVAKELIEFLTTYRYPVQNYGNPFMIPNYRLIIKDLFDNYSSVLKEILPTPEKEDFPLLYKLTLLPEFLV